MLYLYQGTKCAQTHAVFNTPWELKLKVAAWIWNGYEIMDVLRLYKATFSVSFVKRYEYENV